MTNGLGFRPAATANGIGLDIARAVYVTDVANSDARAEGVAYAPNKAVCIDRWEMADSA